jgi:glycine/D-amino acid oxidase-like deaminating enzyme
LKNNKLRQDAGRPVRRLVVADSAPFARDIPAEFEGLYALAPARELKTLLETELDEFVAVISHQKGCINSALFCQEVVAYLSKQFPGRFALYEHTPVRKVVLRHGYAILDADAHTVTTRAVVLCTNGFEGFHILNETGLDIDARYHHLVSGKIGYMSGYLETMNKPPAAISYYTDPIASIENSYYYLTRRPFEYERGVKHNLICIGGPDTDVEESAEYSHEDEFPEEAAQQLDDFLHKVYDLDPNKKIDFIFTWHGLMGYTRNRIRLVGPEPQNPVLLYNLGCNGVGILPSLYGGRTIARHLAGEKLPKSIFDVPRR